MPLNCFPLGDIIVVNPCFVAVLGGYKIGFVVGTAMEEPMNFPLPTR